MKRLTFRDAIIEVLKDEKKGLHYREIADRIIKQKLVESDGLSPYATVGTIIRRDIEKRGDQQSNFWKSASPGVYGYKESGNIVMSVGTIRLKKANKNIYQLKGQLRSNFDSQKFSVKKGRIAENRVEELIVLDGEEGLNCYKPAMDDEGIDFVVKQENSNKIIFIQVKSNFGYGPDGKLVATIKKEKLPPDSNSLIVFVYYDLVEGDISDSIFVVPVDEFKSITGISRGYHRGVFSISMKNPQNSKKFAIYMYEKRELARVISDHIRRFINNI